MICLHHMTSPYREIISMRNDQKPQVAAAATARNPETAEEHAARLADAVSALEELAILGGIASIPDPPAWQRDIREDRPLPGRED